MANPNRWLLIGGALLVTVLLAAGSGLALAQVAQGGRNGRPVVLSSVTPGALDAAGIPLTSAAAPPGCGLLPLRLPGCPISKAAAEAAAAGKFGGTQARVRESVLAQVDAASAAYFGRPFHGVGWVVAVDRTFPAMAAPVAAVMILCPMPVPPHPGGAIPVCPSGRYLVFVSAATGLVQATMPRP